MSLIFKGQIYILVVGPLQLYNTIQYVLEVLLT